MKKKIIGVTVGTPISTSKIADELKPVKTVNGVAPDKTGNVNVNEAETLPIYAEALGEDLDTSKKYVLPDGWVYEYKDNMVVKRTNVAEDNLENNMYLTTSGPTEPGSNLHTTGFIEVNYTTPYRIKIEGVTLHGNSNYVGDVVVRVVGYVEEAEYFLTDCADFTLDDLDYTDGVYTLELNDNNFNGRQTSYMRITIGTADDVSSLFIELVNESTYVGSSEWVKTQMRYVPSDYDTRLKKLEVENEGCVKSVNGTTPDENGNVEIEVGGGTETSKDWELIESTTLLEDVSELVFDMKQLKAITVEFFGKLNNADYTATDANATGIITTVNRRTQFEGQIGFVRNSDNRPICSIYSFNRLNACLFEIAVVNNVGDGSSALSLNNKVGHYDTEVEQTNFFSITPKDDSLLFKAGSAIRVWGIKK